MPRAIISSRDNGLAEEMTEAGSETTGTTSVYVVGAMICVGSAEMTFAVGALRVAIGAEEMVLTVPPKYGLEETTGAEILLADA